MHNPLTVTATIAALHALLLIALSMRVGVVRHQKKIWLLDGGDQQLTRALRVQGNFIEYVPITLLLLALVEYHRAASTTLLWWMGGGLLLARLVHAISLSLSTTAIGRGVGANLTFLVMATAAILLLLQQG